MSRPPARRGGFHNHTTNVCLSSVSFHGVCVLFLSWYSYGTTAHTVLANDLTRQSQCLSLLRPLLFPLKQDRCIFLFRTTALAPTGEESERFHEAILGTVTSP